MIPHGINKLLHRDALGYVQDLLEAKNLPFFISYGVFIGQILAPILIMIGYRTRIASLVLAFTCIMILYLAFSDRIFSFTEHGGWSIERPALFLFGALALAITGGGKYAISKQNKWD